MSRLVLIVAVIVTIAGTSFVEAGPAAAMTPFGSCQLVVEAPFLYAGMVIPVSSVQCGAPARRLRIITTLIQDGLDAADARRDCRNSATCWLTVDASAPDVAGDQTWCTRAVGYENGELVGEAQACEHAEF